MNEFIEFLTNALIIITMSIVILCCAVIDLVDRNLSIIILGGCVYILYKYYTQKA